MMQPANAPNEEGETWRNQRAKANKVETPKVSKGTLYAGEIPSSVSTGSVPGADETTWRHKMAKHINYVGYTVRVNMDEMMPGDGLGIVDFKVRAVEFPEGEEWGCDFCSGPSVAVYELDAEEVLGDAGYNTQYCQEHATLAAEGDPNEWIPPHN